MVLRIEDLDSTPRLHVARCDRARPRLHDPQALGFVCVSPETNLFQVQDHLTHVLLDPRDRGELVRNPFKLYLTNRGTLKAGQENSAQSVA